MSLGEITLQQLSQELIDFINSSGGGTPTGTFIGDLKHHNIEFTATSEAQKVFTLPQGIIYNSQKHVPILTINRTFVPESSYTLTSTTLTLADPGVNIDSKVRLLILYINSSELNFITKDMLSAALITELDNKALATHNHNNDYATKTHIHQDIIDQIPNLPTIATTIEAETGLDNTKMMTPVRVKEAIRALGGSGGTIQSRVFISGMSEYTKLTATVDTTTFTIPEMSIDKMEELIYKGTTLIKDTNYSINRTTGEVTLGFTLLTGEFLFYRTMEKSYQYNDLSGKPAIINDVTTGGTTDILSAEQGKVLKNNIVSNTNKIGDLSTLTTTNKSNLVGAINEVRSSFWGKVNNYLSGDIKDIGEGVWNVGATVLGTPILNRWYKAQCYIVDAKNKLIFLQHADVSTNEQYFIQEINEVWSTWKQIATTDKIDVLLENGFQNLNGYVTTKMLGIKNGNTISINAILQVGTSTSGTVIGRLPVGFRPSVEIRHPQIQYASSIDMSNCIISITGSGDIALWGNATKPYMLFNISFNM